jgi:hypothetical protein
MHKASMFIFLRFFIPIFFAHNFIGLKKYIPIDIFVITNELFNYSTLRIDLNYYQTLEDDVVLHPEVGGGGGGGDSHVTPPTLALFFPLIGEIGKAI